MRKTRLPALGAYAAAALFALTLSGCRLFHKRVAQADTTKSVRLASQPQPIDLSKVQPNEAGRIPILEYHNIVTTPKTRGLEVRAADFRKQLDWLYAHNYRPISLSEYVKGRIDCPAGMSPVILTFDDALLGQFIYTADGKIDPNCAVGILDAFHKQHADWPQKGTFFVLTDIDPKLPAPFSTPRLPKSMGIPDQTNFAKGKMDYLVQEGYELGNHTVHHLAGIKHWPDSRVEAEFAGAVTGIHKYEPNYAVETLALPYGVFPKNQKLVIQGQSGGVKYHNLCALLAGASPAPSPFSKHFNAYRLQRIIPGDEKSKPGSLNTIQYWLNELEKDKTQKFVSDGDPNTYTVNSITRGELDEARLAKAHFHLRTYNGTQLLASK